MKLAITITIAVLTVAGILAAGCGAYKNASKANTAQIQPVNNFEAWSYQVLADAQSGLAETDAKIKSGELPKSLIPDYDRAAVVYNTSIALLKRYDAVFRAGGDVTAIQAEIQQDLADLLSLGLKLWPKKS